MSLLARFLGWRCSCFCLYDGEGGKKYFQIFSVEDFCWCGVVYQVSFTAIAGGSSDEIFSSNSCSSCCFIAMTLRRDFLLFSRMNCFVLVMAC